MLLLYMLLHITAAQQSTSTDSNTISSLTENTTAVEIKTTVPPNVTTIAPQTSTVAPVKLEPPYIPHTDYCTCDLHSKICDINCCCDADCSLEDKKVFSSCKREPNLNRDTSYCQYIDYIYLNNTPYEWEVNQNGLFCIAKTNLPAKYTIEMKPIATLEDSQLQKHNKYSWPETDDELSPAFPSNETFIYGSNVWIIKNKTLQVFELSDSFITHMCLTKRAIKYLQDFKSECSQQDVTERNVQLHPETYFRNISIVRAPQFLNISEILSCPKNICIPINVKECRSCGNTMGCHLNVTTNENICWNLAHKITYNFYHNGSQGFTRIELLLNLKNVSYFPNTDFEFQQEFEVNFHWHNSSLNYSQMLSGNPGYLVGKPVLMGNLANISEFKIERNVIRDNFLTLPASKRGLCVLDNVTHILSEFRCNMLLKCRLRKQLDVQNLTASDLCRIAQNDTFNYWPISTNRSDVNRVIGIFGNANKSSDWLRVLSNTSPSLILNATYGNFTENGLICYLVTTLKIDIFYARVAFKKLLNQNKILGATFNFTQQRKYLFNIKDNHLSYEILIAEEVMFYDVTAEQVEKFVDPPSFTIKLPYDFFYPFIKVGNGADAPCPNVLVKFYCLLSIVSLTSSWLAY